MDEDAEWRTLEDLVDETSVLLRQFGLEFWATWLRRRYAALLAEGASGAGRFVQGWGGMGGFTDLVVHPANGNPIAEADVGPVNRRLQELRSEMYRSAGRIRTSTRR